ncbi:MAG: dihydroxy-acid dehydratase [Firmicutes bacterium]|nr:dihydroxy-acid dehydratase [Bacillota bacterium]
MFWRSKDVLKRPAWSMARAFYKATGYTDYDLERPLIGIANSWNSFVPGHYNLRQVAEFVKTGVSQGGGTPLEFGVIAACDGVAQAHEGMHRILPTRDLIASSIEMVADAHQIDGLVLLGSCDKIVPGMLMAAARLDIPAIMVVGGPMLGGIEFDNRNSDGSSVMEAYGMLQEKKITEEEYYALEDGANPCCGSCSFFGTANSMCCTAEALGMSLPGSAAIPAVYAERYRIAQESGRKIMELVREGITARKIMTRSAMENAIRVGMAMGASTNLILHMLAIAYELEQEISVDLFDELSRTTPHIVKINPAATPNIIDFYNAGGVPAVMKEIASLLDLNALTVNNTTVGENIKDAVSKNREVIRPITAPFSESGGLAVLRGNLAPRTAVTKPAAIDRRIWSFTGEAIVFDSEEEAVEAVSNGIVREGHVVVIRYEGPKGGPGMREMFTVMKMLYGRGLALKTALVTDGRFSGTNNGCFVGHVSPEAAEGGSIAVVKNGDRITIDINERKLHLHVEEGELKERLQKWTAPPPKIKRGYLHLYSRLAESADKGAVIRTRY